MQKYVSGLRRALSGGPAVELAWTGSGYRLTSARIDDLAERRALLRTAMAAQEAGDLHRAAELAGRAEALRRGDFAEGLTGPYLEAERRRWAEKRLTVLDARLAVDIELGRFRECVHELVREVAAHPLRERFSWLLMLALYRSGRSSDALMVYEEARRRIAEAMGADPGPALRSLHRRVLRQDPALLAPSATAA